jgi:hypothetical protein
MHNHTQLNTGVRSSPFGVKTFSSLLVLSIIALALALSVASATQARSASSVVYVTILNEKGEPYMPKPSAAPVAPSENLGDQPSSVRKEEETKKELTKAEAPKPEQTERNLYADSVNWAHVLLLGPFAFVLSVYLIYKSGVCIKGLVARSDECDEEAVKSSAEPTFSVLPVPDTTQAPVHAELPELAVETSAGLLKEAPVAVVLCEAPNLVKETYILPPIRDSEEDEQSYVHSGENQRQY